jgi:hypothetical protein
VSIFCVSFYDAASDSDYIASNGENIFYGNKIGLHYIIYPVVCLEICPYTVLTLLTFRFVISLSNLFSDTKFVGRNVSLPESDISSLFLHSVVSNMQAGLRMPTTFLLCQIGKLPVLHLQTIKHIPEVGCTLLHIRLHRQ